MVSIKRCLKVVGLTLAAALWAHISLSLTLVYLASANFDVRGPNLRKFDFNLNPPETNSAFQFLQPQHNFSESLELNYAYLRHRWSGTAKDQRILFLGSSVTWGYPMQASASLSGAYQKLVGSEGVIASAAVIGGSLEDSMQIGCTIASAPKAGTVFLEIPAQNEFLPLVDGEKYTFLRSSDECAELSAKGSTSYLNYFLRTPFGVSLLSRVQPQYPHVTGAEHMSLVIIPDDYVHTVGEFNAVKKEALIGVNAAIEVAQSVGDKVVAFVSPVYLNGYAELDKNPAYLQLYSDMALNACRRHRGVICLDTLNLFAQDVEKFYNVYHLNREGALALAKYLLSVAGNTKSNKSRTSSLR